MRNAQKMGRSLIQIELVKYQGETYSWGNIMVQTIRVRNARKIGQNLFQTEFVHLH